MAPTSRLRRRRPGFVGAIVIALDLALVLGLAAGLDLHAAPLQIAIWGAASVVALGLATRRYMRGVETGALELTVPAIAALRLAAAARLASEPSAAAAAAYLVVLAGAAALGGRAATAAAVLIATSLEGLRVPAGAERLEAALLIAVPGVALVVLVRLARGGDRRLLQRLQGELFGLRHGLADVGSAGLGGVSEEALLSRSAEAASELQATQGRLLEIARRALGARSAALVKREADEVYFQYVAGEAAGFHPAQRAHAAGTLGAALAEARPVFLNQPRGIADLAACVGSPPVRSFAAAPLGEGSFGLVAVEAPQCDVFTAESARLLEAVAAEIESARLRARVLRHEGEKTAEVQGLYEASRRLARTHELAGAAALVLELTAEFMSFDRGALLLAESGGDMVMVTSRGLPPDFPRRLSAKDKSWARTVLQHEGEGLIIASLEGRGASLPVYARGEPRQRGGGSLVGTQLRVQDRVLGALVLVRDGERAFSAQELRILSILANQAALTLDNARLLKRLQDLASTDGLTGVSNHRRFQEALRLELKRAERQHHPVALVFLDIDHFKRLNDRYGHPVGDSVLKEVAARIRREAREVDEVARYGGEEFAVIVVEADAKRGQQTAERIREAVGGTPVRVGDDAISVTVSLGVAAYPAHAAALEDLVKRADEALYKAKAEGRNRVVTCAGA